MTKNKETSCLIICTHDHNSGEKKTNNVEILTINGISCDYFPKLYYIIMQVQVSGSALLCYLKALSALKTTNATKFNLNLPAIRYLLSTNIW